MTFDIRACTPVSFQEVHQDWMNSHTPIPLTGITTAFTLSVWCWACTLTQLLVERAWPSPNVVCLNGDPKARREQGVRLKNFRAFTFGIIGALINRRHIRRKA